MARLRPSLKAAWGSGRVTGPSAHRQGDPGDASLMLGWAGQDLFMLDTDALLTRSLNPHPLLAVRPLS